MQKLDQCNIIFDFNDASGDMKSKEIKRLALHELLDYVAQNRQVISEPMYPRVVEMFSKNLFRPIPPPVNPQGEAFDPEEDEPVLEVDRHRVEALARHEESGHHDDARHDRRQHDRLQRSDPLAEPPHDGDLHGSEEARGQREGGSEAGRVHRA